MAASHMETPETTLLRYDENPTPVTHLHEKKAHHHTVITVASLGQLATNSSNKPVEPTKREKAEVLNHLLPAIEWEEDGKAFRQKVSCIPAKDEDVKALDETLQQRLRERHAREVEVCPIRRELFTQCFDELLRQVILESPARGVLLRRIRDELRLTVHAYKSMNESTTAYAMRKSVMVERSRAELARVIEANADMLIERRKEVAALERQFAEKEVSCLEHAEANSKKRSEEIDYFKTINSQLKLQLERILSPNRERH